MPKAQLFERVAFIFQLLKVGLFFLFSKRDVFWIKQNAKSPTFWKCCFIFQLLKVGLFCVFKMWSFLIKQNAKSPTFWKCCFYFSIVKVGLFLCFHNEKFFESSKMPKAQLFERFCFIFQLLKVGLFCVFKMWSFLINQNAKSPTFWKILLYFPIVKSWAFYITRVELFTRIIFTKKCFKLNLIITFIILTFIYHLRKN